MSYPFENLDPEKFQHFCQALLTKEFPNMQCFPVAQPDGGRDAITFGASCSMMESSHLCGSSIDSNSRTNLIWNITKPPFCSAKPHCMIIS